MGRKVLYLSHDGLTDPLGQSQILPYIVGLAKKGYSFTILSFEKKTASSKSRQEVRELCEQVGIRWIPFTYHRMPPVLSTIYDLLKLRIHAFKIIRQEHIDIVHCRSYPAALVGLAAKRKFATNFIFDMRGFWADERVEGGLWDIRNIFYRNIYNFFKKKETAFFKEANQTISLTNAGAQIIFERFETKRVTVIPCCADTTLFNRDSIAPLEISSLKDKLGLSGKFVLLYLGSHGTWYLFEQMLDFFRTLHAVEPTAKFLIVSQEEHRIKAWIRERDMDIDSIVVTSASRSEVPCYIALADFLIMFIRPSFSKQASSPTKLAESLSMDVPVLANRGIGDVDQLLEEYRAGVLIDGFTEEFYREAAKKILAFKSESSLRQVALKEFSLQRGITTYEKIYQNLLT